jgi:hypothetical protein
MQTQICRKNLDVASRAVLSAPVTEAAQQQAATGQHLLPYAAKAYTQL